MEFYTVVLRQSASYWVALCQENGIVGQGATRDEAICASEEAIESFQEVYQRESDIYKAPISIE